MLRLTSASIICILFLNNISAQVPPTGILPYRDGRIYYAFNSTIKPNSFVSSVKQPLAQYANNVNKHIKDPARVMKNYVLFEDSTRIISNIKFAVADGVQPALYEGVATFVNLRDSINVIVNDVTLLQSTQRKDLPAIGEPAEKSDYRKNKPAMRLLGEAIDKFIKCYNGRLLNDN